MAFSLVPSLGHAQDSKTVTLTLDLTPFTTPACNGEPVVYTDGMTVTLERTTTDSSGGSHRKNQMKVIGHGVGSVTGYKYKYYTVSNTESQMTNPNPTGAQSDTMTSATNLTGPGPSNNLLMHTVAKTTTNNLGVTTVDFIQVNFECPSDGEQSLVIIP